MSITEKGKWKYVPVEKRFFDDNTFEGFGCMQVLTDYEYDGKGKIITSTTATSKDTKKGKKQKGKSSVESQKTKNKDETTSKTTKEKHKLKQKQNTPENKKEVTTENKEQSKTPKGKQQLKQKPNTPESNKEVSTESKEQTQEPTKKKKRKKRKKKKPAQVKNDNPENTETNITNKPDKGATQIEKSDGNTNNALANGKTKGQPKPQKGNKCKVERRLATVGKLIDITDVNQHTPLDDPQLEKAIQNNAAQKRKFEDDDGPKKKKAKKNKKKQKPNDAADPKTSSNPTEPEAGDGEKKQPKKKNKKKQKPNNAADPKSNSNPTEPEAVDGEKKQPKKKAVNMDKWKDLFVPDPVLKALSDVGFEAPTPIQCLTLPSAIRDRMDILGAAETGSGKTLAFGIPMIHSILQYKEAHPDGAPDSDDEGPQSEDEWDSEGEEKLGENGEEEEGESGEEGEGNEDVEMDEEDENESGNEEEIEGEVEEESEGEDEDEGENEDEGEDEDESEGEDEDELEEDDGGEYDLAPEGEEEFFDLKEGELGCMAAMNNVDFSWMEEGDEPGEAGTEATVPLRKSERVLGPLHGLILTPTRELAIQVKDHLEQACVHTDIKICVLVGGMAAQKQERILRKGPEIVVATPGRFWELLQSGEPHLAKVKKLRTLVVDEADRMVEKGHFEELRNFFEFLKENEVNRRRRQSFIFSATLTLVHLAPQRLMLKRKKVQQITSDDKLESLVQLIGLDLKAKVIDITRKVGTAEALVESKINCTSDEKDIYMYYFLQRYPGRTLVFSNSKDCLRRLVSIFTLLECKPLPLHADMHQKQRLKNLERFKADPNGLLLATDVAARGLDIPNVDHVFHYQVPRTSENYVHRSGRTARASKEGLSVVLIGQEDMGNYRKIIRTLNRSEELGVFPVEPDFLAVMKQRVGLARKIDKEEHRTLKHKKQNQWFEKAAKEMDMELDDDTLLNDLGDSHEQAAQKQRVTYMRRDLKTLLSQPVIPRAFSGRYPTKMGKLDMPLSSSEQGGACAAARKEAKATKRVSLNDTASKEAKKASKKKYKRKR